MTPGHSVHPMPRLAHGWPAFTCTKPAKQTRHAGSLPSHLASANVAYRPMQVATNTV